MCLWRFVHQAARVRSHADTRFTPKAAAGPRHPGPRRAATWTHTMKTDSPAHVLLSWALMIVLTALLIGLGELML